MKFFIFRFYNQVNVDDVKEFVAGAGDPNSYNKTI